MAGQSEGLGERERDRLLQRLRTDASRIAARFDLVYRALLPENPAARHYGICYEDGLIKVRLSHATRGTPLKYSSLVHTVCHELSHLRHFDHGAGFRRFLAEVLAWARRERIYRPGSRSPAPEGECGIAPEERRRFLEEMRRAAMAPPDSSRKPVAATPRQLSLFGD